MSDIVISVEDLYKEYRLGVLGYGTFRQDLQSWWANLRGKEDPNTEIGHEARHANERFLALNGISFDIKGGEVLGIIGRNGAGKSTLLKILSHVTAPTKGQVKIKGRVASLLEVGTGFHLELTGRENVYLNGAILGMTRKETSKKFDEIVGFAEVEKFIDTPVKRYSSGMYVRLAFAVAAHLEPDILIIDEVLAVGDAKFQKKSLGKLESAGKEGRTILFVSHNMPMVASLCNRAILLSKGQIIEDNSALAVIQNYYSQERDARGSVDFTKTPEKYGDEIATLLKARLTNEARETTDEFRIDEDIYIEMEYEVAKEGARVNPNFHIHTVDGSNAFVTSDVVIDPEAIAKVKPGRYLARCKIPGNFLNDGVYYVGFALSDMAALKAHFHVPDLLQLIIVDLQNGTVTRGRYAGSIPGAIRPVLDWESERIS